MLLLFYFWLWYFFSKLSLPRSLKKSKTPKNWKHEYLLMQWAYEPVNFPVCSTKKYSNLTKGISLGLFIFRDMAFQSWNFRLLKKKSIFLEIFFWSIKIPKHQKYFPSLYSPPTRPSYLLQRFQHHLCYYFFIFDFAIFFPNCHYLVVSKSRKSRKTWKHEYLLMNRVYEPVNFPGCSTKKYSNLTNGMSLVFLFFEILHFKVEIFWLFWLLYLKKS